MLANVVGVEFLHEKFFFERNFSEIKPTKICQIGHDSNACVDLQGFALNLGGFGKTCQNLIASVEGIVYVQIPEFPW